MRLIRGQPDGLGEVLLGERELTQTEAQFAAILVSLPQFGALTDGFGQ